MHQACLAGDGCTSFAGALGAWALVAGGVQRHSPSQSFLRRKVRPKNRWNRGSIMLHPLAISSSLRCRI